MSEGKPKATELKGWSAIANFLGQPVSVVQRWSHEGMPVTREGRFVHAEPEQLTRWVGSDLAAHKPVRIASEDESLTADLKSALAYVRGKNKQGRRN